MAEPGSEPVAAQLLPGHDDDLPAQSISKEVSVTTATAGSGVAPGADVVAESNGAADSPPPAEVPQEEEEEKATPTSPPESGTAADTTEEESAPAPLGGHAGEGRPQDVGGAEQASPVSGVDQHLEDRGAAAAAARSESSSSPPLSSPGPEQPDGAAAAGKSQAVEDGLPPAVEDVSASTAVLKEAPQAAVLKEAPQAAGGAVAESSTPAYYLVKWISWKEKKTPIITQSENGPCPLLAIMNTLFLRWKAQLPAQTEVITTEDLMAHLGECVLAVTPREKSDGMELNFQQNMSDAMAVLPKLSTGLDVNVRFTGVTHFEYTPECIVFDLLNIPLYHGWLLDPQSPEMVASVGKLSYNQLVEKIIDCKHSADSSRVSEGLVAEQFLESTATQLSYHGLCELTTTAQEGEISVFFRNNHFSTMIKHKGHLYLLVSDQGFLQEDGLVWESLHNVEGDGNFCDSDFRLCHAPQRAPPTAQEQQRQIDQDYLVAVSLQQQQGGAPGPLSDLELARQLQQEEYQQQQQGALQQQQQGQQGALQAAPQVRGQGSQQAGARRRGDKDSDCVVL